MPDSEAAGRWSDLGTRVASAAVLIAVAAGALRAGALAWVLLVFVVSCILLWELAPLAAPGLAAWRRQALAATPVAALAAGLLLPMPQGLLPLLLALALPAFAGLALLPSGRLIWFGYAAMIAAGVAFLILIDQVGAPPGARYSGPWLVVGLVALVAISDTCGYFVGRLVGGPKFWPRVSPKKTWSGTVAGWIGAGLFGAVVAVTGFSGPESAAAPLALAGGLVGAGLAFAGQMGDIAESAIKRRAGVKDASRLIPGHGGFLDRLDALIAAAALAMIATAVGVTAAFWNLEL